MGAKRKGCAEGYRYGFNGKENDNEVKGNGNQQDYGMRIYDPRLGKFLSVDPVAKAYPFYSPYQFAGNTPIQAIDVDGLEAVVIIGGADLDSKGLSKVMLQTEKNIKNYASSQGLDPNKIKAFNSNPSGIEYEKAEIKKFIKETYKAGEPLILYGYSLGAAVGQNVIAELKKENPEMKVDLFITVDPALSIWSQPLKIPSNVKDNINFYQDDPSSIQSHGYPNFAEDPKKTDVYNFNQTGTVTKDPSQAHGQMDDKNQSTVETLIKVKLNESPSVNKKEAPKKQ